MEASAAWEIVELGRNAWEIVIRQEDQASVGIQRNPLQTDDVPQGQAADELPAAVVERFAETDERLAAIERRLGDLSGSEQRLDDLERAHADAERRSRERAAALRAEIEDIYKQAERRVAESHGKPGWRQRRLEIRLARQERDRKTRRAERRLTERSEESLARIERGGFEAERRLLDRIAAAEERVRLAEERALAASRRAFGSVPGSNGNP